MASPDCSLFSSQPNLTNLQSLCHCFNCQKSTSSAFSTNWIMPRSGFNLVSGEPKTWETAGGSGMPALRKFCGTCSSLLWIESAKFPEIVVVKVGVLDDGAIAKFVPTTEAFTSRKPGWLGCVEGAQQFEEMWHA